MQKRCKGCGAVLEVPEMMWTHTVNDPVFRVCGELDPAPRFTFVNVPNRLPWLPELQWQSKL